MNTKICRLGTDGSSYVHRCNETQHSATIARGLVDSSPGIGTMATIYPSDHPTLAG